MERDYKTVVFGGEWNIGKSSMFIYHWYGEQNPQYIPTKVDPYNVDEYPVGENGEILKVSFIDNEGGGEDWPRLRHLGYLMANAVVLCFSIAAPETFELIEEYWYPFTQKHCPTAKLFLLSTKKDLRNDEKVIRELSKADERPVTYNQGKNMANKIGAIGYYECSTRLGEGVEEIFKASAKAAYGTIDPKPKLYRKRKCLIM
ncbi:transforming protein RhoA-like [Clytia hemisphaerica]|uniref:transforming protein RhoA-like n=1 Tax=Clytia hemisphaerica TaxID=252671 RepID=UPI0034D70909